MSGFKLDIGYSSSSAYYNGKKELKFNPPVYEQRYMMVIRVLEHEHWRGDLKKVVEFGCADMKFFTLLKTVPGVERILQVDIDEDTLKSNIFRIKPLLVDHLKPRIRPFVADIYKGSISEAASCLENTDVVICIEVIEHLNADVFEEMPYNIFGFINPKLAIFTTPNSEANRYFNLTEANGFRHPDHKFEWTRKQFQDWCQNICLRFPNYTFSLMHVGKLPPDKRKHGSVSQLVVFIRKDLVGLGEIEKIQLDGNNLGIKDQNYKLLESIEYPFKEDNRNYKEKILDEAKYHIDRYVNIGDIYLNVEKNCHEIPLTVIYDFVFPLTASITELSSILSSDGYLIEDNRIIIAVKDEDVDSEDENNFFGEDIWEDVMEDVHCNDNNDDDWG